MSHFTTIKTANKLTNAQLLVKALTSLGLENVEYHEESQDLNDYQKVRGGEQISFQKANVIVPWESNTSKCYADFGYQWQGDELVLVADSMDSRRMNNLAPKLQTAYNQLRIEAIEDKIWKTANTLNKGTPQIERSEVDGKIQLKIAFPSDIRRHNLAQQQQIRR